MSTSLLLLLICGIALLGFVLGRLRATSTASSAGGRRPHSRPGYHAWFVLVASLLPALLVVALWSAASPAVVSRLVRANLPADELSKPRAELSLTMSTVGALAKGLELLSPAEIAEVRSGRPVLGAMLEAKGIPLASAPTPHLVSAALDQVTLARQSASIKAILGLAISIVGLLASLWRIGPDFRARNRVESVMLAGLAGASTVAILTTVGIVLSMLFETVHFFSLVPASDSSPSSGAPFTSRSSRSWLQFPSASTPPSTCRNTPPAPFARP